MQMDLYANAQEPYITDAVGEKVNRGKRMRFANIKTKIIDKAEINRRAMAEGMHPELTHGKGDSEERYWRVVPATNAEYGSSRGEERNKLSVITVCLDLHESIV